MNAQELRDKVIYDKDTGKFFTKRTGREKGFLDPHGYVVVRIDGIGYKAHRLAWLYMTGEYPENSIDHINHVRSDNRFGNLRACTALENSRNQVKRCDNTSGHTGVYWDKERNKWLVCICNKGHLIKVGRFENIEDAIFARKKAEFEFGFHDNHGKPSPDGNEEYLEYRRKTLRAARDRTLNNNKRITETQGSQND